MYGLRGMGLADPVATTGAVVISAAGSVDRFGRGVNDSDWANCRGWTAYLNPGCYFAGPKSMIAPPRAPTGDMLTVPPASGEEAQATVDELLNQQLWDQQALNAGQVSSSWWDELAGGTSQVVESSPGGLSIWAWLALGIGGFALVAVGAGSPRRYGR
jgi:hypothetical protein